MKARVSVGITLSSVLALSIAAFAQGVGQQPTPSPAQPGASSSSEQQVTITGCVEREADYRKAHEAGRGGVAGTGVGVGNEFVLTNASRGVPGAKSETEATGTSGTAAAAMAYELTGPNEGEVAQFVGQRVEIRGKLKAAETDASGRPTGGATAGAPPSGTDVMSKDLKLRELEVTSVRAATGSCSPIK